MQPPPSSDPSRVPPPSPRPGPCLLCGLAAAVLLLASTACSHAAQASLEGARPAEALLEVLPPGAEVTLDGAPLGAGSRVIAAARRDRAAHVVAATSPGFEPGEWRVPPGGLAGIRVGLALRPEGFPGAVELDDATSLVRAADFLGASGRSAEAQAYAARAAALAPDLPSAHRALGSAAAAAGDRRAAERSFAEYLRLVPDAPDAEDVEAALAGLAKE